MKLQSLLTIAFLGLTVGLASQANAQSLTSPVTFTGGAAQGTLAAFNGWEMGYKFEANTAITVADLSVYDSAGSTGNGLAVSIPVGIWNSSGTLLGSVIVPAGSDVPIQDDFRYAALSTPITLVAGQTYYVAAWYENNGGQSTQQAVARQTTNQVYDPSITWLNSADINIGGTGNLTFPNGSFGTNGLFGGSFLESTQAVPEPGTWALMVGGLSLLVVIQRRKRKLGL